MAIRRLLTEGRLSCLAALLLLAGCASKDGTSLRVGAIAPFTGEGAIYGKAARTGIELALNEINAAGGVRGRRLEVVYEDDKGNPRDAVSAFQKLATINKVPAVLGPFYSGNVLACAPEAEKLRVVLLTASATSDNIKNAGEYTFRVCPTNALQASTVAEFAVKQMGLKSAYILYRNAEYGVTLRDAFNQSFPKMGGRIVGVEAVPPDATDVRAQLAKAKAASPALIFAAVHAPEGGVILRQAKELGLSTVIIGTDGGFDPQLFRVAGDAAENSYWATIGWASEAANPLVGAFKQKYRALYGEDPGSYSGLYYDATHVIALALAACSNIDGPCIQRSMFSVSFAGPTGLNKFDSLGEVDKPFALYQVRGASFVPISQVTK